MSLYYMVFTHNWDWNQPAAEQQKNRLATKAWIVIASPL